MTEISNKTVISGLAWRFAEKTSIQIVSFAISVIIARMIEPEAYGVVAIVNAVIAILDVFVDSGLANSLIQKKNPDDLDYSSVFFANIFFCAILYTVLYWFAPFFADFYKLEKLTPLIRVAGLGLLVSSLKNVQHAYIAKNMMYKKFFFASLGGTIAAGVIGISMAFMGYGVWALLATNLSDAVIDALIIWFTIKWRPKMMFSYTRLNTLMSFGWKLLVSRLIDVSYGKLHQFVIGKYYTAADLAFYDKGESLPNKILGNIDYSINNVMKPVLSQKQDDIVEMKKAMINISRTSFFVMSPLLFGMAAVSEPLVILMFTEKWINAIPFVRIMCFVNLFTPIESSNTNVIRAMGRSDLYLKNEIYKKTVSVICLIAMIPFGTYAMALSLFFSSFVSFLISSKSNKKLINYGMIDQIKDISPSLLCGLIMYYIVFAFGQLPVNYLQLLLIQIVVGGSVYVLLTLLIKNPAYIYLVQTIKSLQKNSNNQ